MKRGKLGVYGCVVAGYRISYHRILTDGAICLAFRNDGSLSNGEKELDRVSKMED